MRRMLLVAASAMLPACLLFTSLDDASGGADPANDSGSDTNASDAPLSPSDAAGDAVADANLAARFCEQDGGPGLVFCADFDGTDLAEGWSGLASGAGELLLDQKALLAKVPTTTAYSKGKHLFRDIDGVFTSLSCSFAFRRDVLGDESVIIAALAVETNAEYYTAYLYATVTSGQLLVQKFPADGGEPTATSGTANFGFPIGEWHRLTIEATKTQVRASIDGQLETSLVHDTTAKAIRTKLELGEPEISASNTKPWELRFDDVRCNLIP